MILTAGDGAHAPPPARHDDDLAHAHGGFMIMHSRRHAVPIGAIMLLIFLMASTALPQNLTKTGTTAAPFLKIGVGSRAVAMGGAFTATADDITAMYWNPGGLANVYASEATFNHVKWFADINYDFAAFSTHLTDFGTLGGFVSVMSMDDMLVRTEDQPEGTGEYFTSGSMAIGISFARSLTDRFSIGFNLKYVRDYLWNMSANGVALDIGTMYKIPILNEFRLAASISNFGTKMKLAGRDNVYIIAPTGSNGNLINSDIQLDEYDLPLVFRVGVAADVVKTDEHRVTMAVDAVHPNDNTEYLNTGAEYGWDDMVFLRGGWKSLFERDTEQGFTAGIGVQYRIVGEFKVKVDYAYEDWGRLKNVHYLSLSVRF
jgi:opacity protein-like surface antigen